MTIKKNKKKNTFLNNIDLDDLTFPYTKELDNILLSYSFDDIDVLKKEEILYEQFYVKNNKYVE